MPKNSLSPEISAYFSALGRKGGKKRKLGTSKAKEIGRLGAEKRWGKKPDAT